MKCYECNIELVPDNSPYKYEESGLSNLYLTNFKHFKCPKCGDEVIEIPRIWFLHLAVGLALINKAALLRGEEISFLRREMNMSSQEFAERLGVTHYAVSKWENEKKEPSSRSDKAIRLLFWNNMQKMLADRLDGLEEAIQRQKVFTIVRKKIEVDMPKLECIPQPHMIPQVEKQTAYCH
ncbi:MAG: type II TA system antitoxin MqsA family protein [Pseudomonadota bacterium]